MEQPVAPPGEDVVSSEEGFREQDRFLPITNVYRIMRKSVPENTKISKDAKELVQECVSEFISFITSEASDKCISARRKTITGDDIITAMEVLGFDNYVVPLSIYLQRYREASAKRPQGRRDSNAQSRSVAQSQDDIDDADASPMQTDEMEAQRNQTQLLMQNNEQALRELHNQTMMLQQTATGPLSQLIQQPHLLQLAQQQLQQRQQQQQQQQQQAQQQQQQQSGPQSFSSIYGGH